MNHKANVAKDLFNSNSLPAVSVVDITPEIARQWLERNIGNRPASQAHIAKLERSIRDGKWKMTGDAIRFSKTGKLIDGQHRLQAILNSGVSVTCVVMHNLDDEIFDVIDGGKGRQKSDLLFIELGLPVETCRVLATAAALAIDYEKQSYKFGKNADKGEVMDFVKRNPLIIASAEHAQSLPRHCPVPRSIAAMFHFYAAPRDHIAAARFLERFMIGAVDGAGDNLLYLRNRCSEASGRNRRLPTSIVLRAMIRYWNAEQRGKPIKYAANALREDDAFPTFI